MERFVFSPPAAWRAGSPGQYVIGDAKLTVSELMAFPEDLAVFLSTELKRLPFELERAVFPSGWPVFAGTARQGDGQRLVLVLQIIDRCVIAWLDAPIVAFEAARVQVVEALGTGTLDWGEPGFLCLAELLEGVPR